MDPIITAPEGEAHVSGQSHSLLELLPPSFLLGLRLHAHRMPVLLLNALHLLQKGGSVYAPLLSIRLPILEVIQCTGSHADNAFSKWRKGEQAAATLSTERSCQRLAGVGLVVCVSP